MILFTDPHLGRSAAAHTTPASRAALTKALADKAMACVKRGDGQYTSCLGDLFDSYSNREDILLQGAQVLSGCDFMLSGNHDLSNREDKKGSLQLLDDLVGDGKVSYTGLGKSGYNEHEYTIETGTRTSFVSVPHHSDQAYFDQTIETLCKSKKTYHLCFLHCNYDNDLADNDSSLNLTKAQVAALLERFEYVVLGHEHTNREDFGGRLLLLGNTHPTSFGDISDKYVWHYDEETRKFDKELIWSSADYLEVDVDSLISGAVSSRLDTTCDQGEEKSVKFIQVVGDDIPSEKAAEISKAMAELWAKFPDKIFMLKNSVNFKSENFDQTVDKVQLEDVPKLVGQDIKDEDMRLVYESHLEKVGGKS